MAAENTNAGLAELPAWQQRAFPLAVALFRGTFGLLFLSNGLAKLPGLEDLDYAPFPGFLIGYAGAEDSLRHDTSNHPLPVYRDFMEDVILDNYTPFGVALITVEIGVGALLVLGVFSSAAALLGFLSLFHIWFANWGRYSDRSLWAWEGPIEWMPLLALASWPRALSTDSTGSWPKGCLAVFDGGRWLADWETARPASREGPAVGGSCGPSPDTKSSTDTSVSILHRRLWTL